MAVQPPRPRMPPLNALRAFEAAARTGAFATAAAELNVTTAAVASHVKALEAWLGCALFVRKPQGVRLSERGEAALPMLVAAFDALGEAVRGLNQAAQPGQVTIAALPAVASLWLAPMLAAMREAFPDLSVSITATETPPNLRREPYDLALFFLSGDALSPGETPLRIDRLTPVCSPAIAPSPGEDPAVWLRRQTLLHDPAWASDWDIWLRAAGMHGKADLPGARFSLYSLAVQATREGAGVLIGHEALVSPAIASGELVAPFQVWVETDRRLSALSPERPLPLIKRLIDWLARTGPGALHSSAALAKRPQSPGRRV